MKNLLDGVCKILYFIYGMFLIYPINRLTNMGLLNTDIKLFNLIRDIPSGEDIYYMIFQVIFIGISHFMIKTMEKQVIALEGTLDIDKLNENLLIYKLNICATIIFSIVIIYITKDYSLFLPSLLMFITSGLIFYCKKLYYKACQLDKLSNLSYKKDINSTWWRFKVWYNKKEKVEFKYRQVEIIENILYIAMMLLILKGSRIGSFELLFVYFILKNAFALIENIFNIFTYINGTCTAIYEHTTRANTTYYKVVVTDYTNKREVKVKIESDLFISEGDYLEVIHGVFSKQLISINSLIYTRGSRSGWVFPMLGIFLISCLK